MYTSSSSCACKKAVETSPVLMCIPVEMEIVSSVSRVVSDVVGEEGKASVHSCSNPRTTMRDLQIVSFSLCTHLDDRILPVACSSGAVS